MSLRTIFTRFPTSRIVNMTASQSRMLSYQGECAIKKLKQVMEDYRVAK